MSSTASWSVFHSRVPEMAGQSHLNFYPDLETVKFCIDKVFDMILQAKIGRENQSEAALQRLRGRRTNISREVAEIRVSFELNV